MNTNEQFSLKDKVAIITGGGGILGRKHAEAIAEMGGIPALWDIRGPAAQAVASDIQSRGYPKCGVVEVDITDPQSVRMALQRTMTEFNRVDILINNAASDPKVENGPAHMSRFENMPLEMWEKDLSVGLTGAFLCSQVVGTCFARQKRGVILNVASDLSIISPDQRLYQVSGLPDDEQPVKAVTYSVVKHGILGLTKYLSTYWAHVNVRVNSLSPGGIYNERVPDEFVKKITNLIPMRRMATQDEYKAAVVFLCSDAAKYMTGQNLIIDGGRTVW